MLLKVFNTYHTNNSNNNTSSRSHLQSPRSSLNMTHMITNPFHVNLTNFKLTKEDLPSDAINTKLENSSLVILCLKDRYTPEDVLLLRNNIEVDLKLFNKCKRSFTLLKGYTDMIPLHKNYSMTVSREDLYMFDHNSILYTVSSKEESVCVIPFFDLLEEDLKMYLTLYQKDYSIRDLQKLTVLYHRYCNMHNKSTQIAQNYTHTTVQQKLSAVSNQLTDSCYWDNKSNLIGLNFTKLFKNRDYTNASHDIYKEALSSYKVLKDTTITIEETTNMFRIVHNSIPFKRLLYDYLNVFLMSPSHCHLVLNNPDVLDIVNPIIKKFKRLYRILFGYAWLSMYLEHKKNSGDCLESDRFVFSINTANKLPIFPYTNDNIHINPYNTVLVSSEEIDEQNNYNGLSMMYTTDISSPYFKYGVDTLENFKMKFNIITTGNPDKGLLDGYDNINGRWDNIAFTSRQVGMSARATDPRISRAISVTDIKTLSIKEVYMKLFSSYKHINTSIITCSYDSVFDFLDTVKKIKKTIFKNMSIKSGTKDSFKCEKGVTISTTVNYVKSIIKEAQLDTKVEINKKHINEPAIKELFWFKYNTVKKIINKNYEAKRDKNSIYEDFFRPIDFNKLNIILVDELQEPSQISCKETEYFYTEPDLDKPLFKITENILYNIPIPNNGVVLIIQCTESITSVVSKANIPFERMYYTGDNVYMFPEAITAMMTNSNIEHRSIYSLVNKIKCTMAQNICRSIGIGSILNSTEKIDIQVTSHMSDDALGTKSLSDSMYRPIVPVDRMSEIIPYNLIRGNGDLQYYYTISSNSFMGTHQKKLDLFSFSTINKSGSVEPFNRWLLDAVWDLYDDTE